MKIDTIRVAATGWLLAAAPSATGCAGPPDGVWSESEVYPNDPYGLAYYQSLLSIRSGAATYLEVFRSLECAWWADLQPTDDDGVWYGPEFTVSKERDQMSVRYGSGPGIVLDELPIWRPR
jgi:hypothetical protein